jgi:16S rRNA (adenine1518-N6/adenine1519-N6)-dimethyltransferase
MVSSTSPKILLRHLGLTPKKSLGQHFLLHPHQAQRLVNALGLKGEETVVEIGPGLGALTVFLAEAAGRVVALERDRALAQFLRDELFANTPGVEVVCTDALAFSFEALSRETGGPLVLAGNLPYQITSPLLFKLMAARQVVSRAVFMMQQEVADRLLARPGTRDYGIITVLVQYHFRLALLFSLAPGNFFPAPQVTSAVLAFEPSQPEPPAQNPELMSRLVKAAFGQRRKTLNNTLVSRAAAFGLAPEELKSILQELEIDPGRRGETLSVGEYVALSNRIVDLKGRH